jgi:hypothetical protein
LLPVKEAHSVIDTDHRDVLLAAIARIEQRQTAYEQVAHRMLDILEVHTEKLDLILEAATQDPGPSRVADALAAILSSLREQESLLQDLTHTLAATIRDELQRDLDEETPNGRSDGGPHSLNRVAGDREQC